MNTFRLIAVALAIATITSTFRASPDDVSMLVSEMPASEVLQMYGIIAGAKVLPSEQVRNLKRLVSLRVDKKSKTEAMRLIEAALLAQAGVELVRRENARVEARLAAEPAPPPAPSHP